MSASQIGMRYKNAVAPVQWVLFVGVPTSVAFSGFNQIISEFWFLRIFSRHFRSRCISLTFSIGPSSSLRCYPSTRDQPFKSWSVTHLLILSVLFHVLLHLFLLLLSSIVPIVFRIYLSLFWNLHHLGLGLCNPQQSLVSCYMSTYTIYLELRLLPDSDHEMIAITRSWSV